jgi:hypothetical protein
MLRLRYLLPIAAFAMVLIGGAPSRGETIIDDPSSRVSRLIRRPRRSSSSI